MRAMPAPIIVPQKPVPRDRSKTVQCWAHTKSGNRCTCSVARTPEDATPSVRDALPVPMCAKHMAAGDGALKVVTHPTFGKILVARYDLPKGYRTACASRADCAALACAALYLEPPPPIANGALVVAL